MTSRESLATALLVAMYGAPGHLAQTPKEMVARAVEGADLMLSALDRRPKDRFPVHTGKLQYVPPNPPF